MWREVVMGVCLWWGRMGARVSEERKGIVKGEGKESQRVRDAWSRAMWLGIKDRGRCFRQVEGLG